MAKLDISFKSCYFSMYELKLKEVRLIKIKWHSFIFSSHCQEIGSTLATKNSVLFVLFLKKKFKHVKSHFVNYIYICDIEIHVISSFFPYNEG